MTRERNLINVFAEYGDSHFNPTEDEARSILSRKLHDFDIDAGVWCLGRKDGKGLGIWGAKGNRVNLYDVEVGILLMDLPKGGAYPINIAMIVETALSIRARMVGVYTSFGAVVTPIDYEEPSQNVNDRLFEAMAEERWSDLNGLGKALVEERDLSSSVGEDARMGKGRLRI